MCSTSISGRFSGPGFSSASCLRLSGPRAEQAGGGLGRGQVPGRTCALTPRDTEAEPACSSARNLKAGILAPLRLKGLHLEKHTQARAQGGCCSPRGLSLFLPCPLGDSLPHPQPGPVLSSCTFSKGQSGCCEANRFVPGHGRIQGHGSQPGEYPFPPPGFLVVQGHRHGGCPLSLRSQDFQILVLTVLLLIF